MDRSAGCTLCQNRFYRDIASRREYLNSSALSNMYHFFILAFGLFYAKVLCPVFFWAFSESALMQMCYFVFVFMHARHTLLSLCLCSNSHRNTLNNGSKDQNLCLLVECVTVLTNLGTGGGGGGTKRQQSFLFGSEG